MGEVGCYTLDLYCDNPNHEGMDMPRTYTGKTLAEYTARLEEENLL